MEILMTVEVPVLVEAESRAVRRGVPDPRIPLPQAAVPTVLLFVASLAVWGGATWLVLAAHVSAWLTVPLHALVSFAMFTVVHECVHHAAGRQTWLNELLGRLALPFVGVYFTFPVFRFVHIEHHRNTNENLRDDPDMWSSHGPSWQLPLRWATLEVSYVVFYLRALRRRPSREWATQLGAIAATAGGSAWAVQAGYGWQLAAIVFIPQRVGQTVLGWWFDWLPHHGLKATAARDNYRATRNRVGMEWLLSPVMLYQNYHSVHHLHPAIPFYRYVQAWRRNAAVYLERNVPLATMWGRELTPSEYLAWRGLTHAFRTDETREPGAPAGRADFHRLTVSEVRPLAPDAVSITFDIPRHLRETFQFTAGQHLVLRTILDGAELRRTYSICAAATSGVVRIGVRHLADGRVSGLLNTRVRVGDVLEVGPPAGRFTLVPKAGSTRHYAGIAAGSGITPIISMLATALTVEPDSRFTLLYANRTADTTMFRDELKMLQRQFEGRLSLIEYRDREQVDEPDVVAGPITPDSLTALLTGELPPYAVDGWYMCGPEPMLDMVRTVLGDCGVSPGKIHYELFRAATTTTRDDSDVACALTAALGNEQVSVDTRPGQTVLEALLDNGVNAPYSCMGGACGTCRAKITHGHARMDQCSALEDDEVERGYVLTCQARPTTHRLDVDYEG
jgi:ferredoxin-NADP reductase/fatty acid desaturase